MISLGQQHGSDDVAHACRKKGDGGVTDRGGQERARVADMGHRSENEHPTNDAGPVGNERQQGRQGDEPRVGLRQSGHHFIEVDIPQEERQQGDHEDQRDTDTNGRALHRPQGSMMTLSSQQRSER